ncbi:acetyl-CoA carboxylase biotin carboxylase subunit family protein [Kutzneria buriramensis]|uniref:ATP-grasp domain-containing protein n=1 Tax=Kutzneria buriramensis TaxID=1045776 RepID=A0A3E0HHU9_9PSEU|nr:ATP-grasp domain-containing protein [Kutzneria buriramensis]REH46017.1 ATP-grasp domain-containing protein [Kutzneria buriramensis]
MSESSGVLLVVGSGLKVYREYLVRSVHRRAKAAGLGLVLLNNLKPTWQRQYFDEIIVSNVFDPDEMTATARAVADRHHIVGLMCWDEPVVLAAGELAAELGVPGLSVDGVRGCRDKNRTRTVLTAEGLLQPGYALTTSLAQARAEARRIGYPVVLKPRAMGASIGVVFAADESELDAAFGVAMGAATIDPGRYRAGAIVEGYAAGPEISVDAALHKGEYLPMFVARKQTSDQPYFEEVGHVVDAADPLLHDTELMGALARAHRALGVEDGITHSEVRLTDRGPLIIEVNGRLGGDLIPFLGRTATGIDPGEVLFDVTVGHRPDTTPTRRAVAGIRFGYPELDCLVHSVTVPTEAPGLVTASPMIDAGTTLRLPPGGYLARHSFVVCQAEDRQTCSHRLDAAAALVRVDADPVAPPPPGAAFEMPAGLLDVDEEEGVSA